ncbi:MAG: flagellar filament capping protein FliD [Planctomycetota bacterium]|nr:flagellar filament capping protein FliD [Planctomycetota bacterium]
MSGITTGIGIFSGVDSRSIIDQLIALEARPRTQLQTRSVQLQQRQTIFLDLNNRLNTLKNAGAAFRNEGTFNAKSAASSNAEVLNATADSTAAEGSYTFIIDRLVSSQSQLSRGFANRDVSAVGVTKVSVESARARLDRDVSLSDLNGGQGVARGKIVITDSAGNAATVDLSKAATVSEVVDIINSNGVARVTASVRDGRFVITNNASGSGTLRVENAVNSTAATSLGLTNAASNGVITGNDVFTLSANTSLASLNDGNGVSIRSQVGTGAKQFTITVDRGSGPVEVEVNLGDLYDSPTNRVEGAVSTLGGALERINEALSEADLGTIQASISSDGKRIQIVDTDDPSSTITIAEDFDGSTARDLGILGTGTGGITGKRIQSGLSTTLARSLNGGSGVAGNGALNFTLRNGATFTANVGTDTSLAEIAKVIEDASASGGAARVRVGLNAQGTGLEITDLTSGSSNLTITGTSGADTAASLGISTGSAGVASNTVKGTDLQRQYISAASLLSTVNNGASVGTGQFRITDSTGASQTVNIADTDKTIDDVLKKINALGLRVTARINQNGDGIEIVENSGVNGATKIKVEDVSGLVAKGLNIAGEASGTGSSNKLDGTFQKSVTVLATDNLQEISTKLNAAKLGVSSTIIREGNGATPFRLSLTSQSSGSDGRMIISTEGADLGLATIDRGQDAKVFFGSSDPAAAVLLSSSRNTLDGVISGVSLDLRSTNASPVTISVTRNNGAVETAANAFITAFNDLVARIDSQSTYDETTKRRGALLGDGTAVNLRNALFSTVLGPSKGGTGTFSNLADIGISVGENGRLELDATRLREAISEDASSVEALLGAKDTSTAGDITRQGVPGLVEELAKRYTDSVDGVFTQRRSSFDNQIRALQSRIDSMTTRLDARRVILERQFLAMERSIADLRTQSSYLSNLG